MMPLQAPIQQDPLPVQPPQAPEGGPNVQHAVESIKYRNNVLGLHREYVTWAASRYAEKTFDRLQLNSVDLFLQSLISRRMRMCMKQTGIFVMCGVHCVMVGFSCDGMPSPLSIEQSLYS